MNTQFSINIPYEGSMPRIEEAGVAASLMKELIDRTLDQLLIID
jgi:hypothetical protein